MTTERRITYDRDIGYLHGKTPNQTEVVVGHERSDRTGYVLYWNGSHYERFGQDDIERIFGIIPHPKRSGPQRGYTSEPAIRAVWRYLADRYNNGDSEVKFSNTRPDCCTLL